MHSDEIGETTSPAAGDTLSWAELLEAYRRGPREEWAGLLLERLGPWLTVAKRQLPAVAPYLDSDDVAQELVFEVLRIATRWRPSCENGWIPRRLVERAARHVSKQLMRERFSATKELSDDLVAAERAEPELVFETPIGEAIASELRVLYRFKVLREPIGTLARESGLTEGQMRRRIRIALAHARATTPGGSPK